jgi:hypothetical protein
MAASTQPKTARYSVGVPGCDVPAQLQEVDVNPAGSARLGAPQLSDLGRAVFGAREKECLGRIETRGADAAARGTPAVSDGHPRRRPWLNHRAAA